MKPYAPCLFLPLALFSSACLSDEPPREDSGSTSETTNGSADPSDTTDGASTTFVTTAVPVTESSGSPTGSESDGEGSDTTSGTAVSIYDIQQGQIPAGSIVAIEGAVVTGVSFAGFFAQDPEGGEWSGLWVYTGDDGPDITGLEPGDVVDVSGEVDEFFDLTQIDVRGGSLTETGTAEVPEPAVITLAEAEEPWEGVLVRVEAGDDVFTVTEQNATENVNEFTFSLGDDTLIIDDHIYDIVEAAELEGFGVGATFTAVQGPLNFSFEEFKVAPRDLADIEGFAPPK